MFTAFRYEGGPMTLRIVGVAAAFHHGTRNIVTQSEVGQPDRHTADLATQEKHGVNYLRYWVDEKAGKIFCLVEAPDAEAANTVHREAHGLVAEEIYEVTEHS